MQKAKILIIFSLIILAGTSSLPFQGSCEYLHVKDSGFTKLSISARAMGMGGAFVAVADDYSACYYNPAGLSGVKQRELGSMYTNLYGLGLLSQSYLTFVEPDTGLGSGGVSWNHLSADLEPEEWLYDLWSYSYAREIGAASSWGINLKYLKQTTSWEDATGYSFDLGYIMRQEKMSFGVCLQDIYSKIEWGTGHKETIPSTLKVGFSFKPTPSILIALDTDFTLEDLPRSVQLGSELKMGKLFALRAGLINKFQPEEKLIITAGLGLKIKFSQKNGFNLDYAFVTNQELSSSHYFSFSLIF